MPGYVKDAGQICAGVHSLQQSPAVMP